jgi:hypothetical protein
MSSLWNRSEKKTQTLAKLTLPQTTLTFLSLIVHETIVTGFLYQKSTTTALSDYYLMSAIAPVKEELTTTLQD